MTTREIPFRTILSIWWSMTWRIPFYVLGAFLLVGLVAITVTMVMAAMVEVDLVSSQSIEAAFVWLRNDPFAILFEWLLWIAASVWALKTSLSKRHSGFQIGLVNQSAD